MSAECGGRGGLSVLDQMKASSCPRICHMHMHMHRQIVVVML